MVYRIIMECNILCVTKCYRDDPEFLDTTKPIMRYLPIDGHAKITVDMDENLGNAPTGISVRFKGKVYKHIRTRLGFQGIAVTFDVEVEDGEFTMWSLYAEVSPRNDPGDLLIIRRTAKTAMEKAEKERRGEKHS
jgi:hypothetical protein